MLQYEKENTYRTNAYSTIGMLGKEFNVHNNFSLITGVKGESVFGSYDNLAFKSMFVTVPVQLRLYSSSESNSAFYGGIGIENKFKIYENIDNVNNNTETKGENGYHLGGIAEIGYRTKAHENLDFLIGLNYSNDILQVGYDNGKNKLLNGINLSIGFEFYKNNK